jgi:putative transposase
MPEVAAEARHRKHSLDRSWRMDETYERVKGKWVYLDRAVDKFGKTLDFMLPRRRNNVAATEFFACALQTNGMSRKIVIDKSGANTAGINEINRMLKRFGCPVPIEMVRIKYLNNIVEQDHRFIKRRIRLMLGFKSFEAAASMLAGIEVASMIRKGQFRGEVCPFQQFANHAASSGYYDGLYSQQTNICDKTICNRVLSEHGKGPSRPGHAQDGRKGSARLG